MTAVRKNKLEIENSGTSFGVTNGDVTNDNRTMNGNNIVSGNQINNAIAALHRPGKGSEDLARSEKRESGG